MPDESLAFRIGRRAVAVRLAVVLAGAILVTYALFLGPDRSWTAAAIGGLVCVIGLGDLVVPVYVVQAQGLLLVRQGILGLNRMIRWTSMREVRSVGDNKLAVRLVDGSWDTVYVRSLAPADRERLQSEIQRRIGHG